MNQRIDFSALHDETAWRDVTARTEARVFDAMAMRPTPSVLRLMQRWMAPILTAAGIATAIATSILVSDALKPDVPAARDLAAWAQRGVDGGPRPSAARLWRALEREVE